MVKPNDDEDIGEAQVNEAALIQMFSALTTNAIMIAGETAVFSALETVCRLRHPLTQLAHANLEAIRGMRP